MTSKLRRTGPAAPSAPPSLLPLWGLHSRPRSPFTPHPPHPSLPLPTGRRCPPPPSRLSAAAIPSGRLPGLPNPGSGCVPSHCAPTLVHSVASPQRGHSCAAFQLEPWFWLGGAVPPGDIGHVCDTSDCYDWEMLLVSSGWRPQELLGILCARPALTSRE